MPIFVYDIIIAVIVLYCVHSGYKKGLFLTACGFLAMFVALFGALYVTNAFASTLGDAITPMIEAPIRAIVESELPNGVTLDSLDGLSDSAAQLTEAMEGIPMIASFMDEIDLSALDVVASGIVASTASFIALQLARILLFFFSFIVILLGWTILSHTLNLTFNLPLLSTANVLAGAGVGLVQGLFIAYIIAWALSWGLLSASEIESTMVLKYFLIYNPIPMIASIFASITGQ